MAEQGFPGFDATAWYALMAPAGTAQEIIERLRREMAKILVQPDLRKKLDDQGMELVNVTPAELADAIRSEALTWAKVVREAGIKAGE